MTWLMDGRTLARKVKNSSWKQGSSHRTKNIECPSCGCSIDQKNVVQEWPGLPAGVKFDPTDQELLEHLAAKVGSSCSADIHPFIDEFIPTLDGEDGICYTHPEKLPGVRRDGSCTHYFHKPARAYTTGNRKRRKIQSEVDDNTTCETRWHKTGKTRPIMENGMQLGCKKIMVLYVTVGKKEKPAKTNWVMHQYHLGVEEDEKDGELVVSKVFYQMQPRANVGGGRKTDEENLEAAPADVMEELLKSDTKSDVPGFTKSQSPEETSLMPKVITSLNPFVGKQPGGLLQAITEDADRLTSSFNGSSVYSRECPMGNLDYFHEEGKDPEIEKLSSFTEISQGCQSGKQGAVNKVLSSEVCHDAQNLQNDCLPLANHRPNNACNSGNQEGISEVLSADNLGSYSQNSQETLDADFISLLCDENLPPDVASKKATKKSTRKGLHKTKVLLDSHLTLDDVPDEEATKAYSSLENIVLDTPPDFLLENFMGSKMGMDSQSQTGFISSQDFNVLDFLRDSQSSTQN